MRSAPIIFCFSLTGCVTSQPFRNGAHALGPRIASRAAAYAIADATLTPAVKAQRIAQALQLSSATTVEANVSRPNVASIWQSMRAWYVPYVQADTSLDADAMKLELRAAADMDRLLADDKARPFSEGR